MGVEEMAVVKMVGDEHSNLLDQYERLTFEARLNQAMLGRSLSEPRTRRVRSQPHEPQLTGSSSAASVRPPYLITTTTTTHQPRKRRPGSGSTFNFNKIITKLLKPILDRKRRAKKELPDFTNPISWKALSKSMRL